MSAKLRWWKILEPELPLGTPYIAMVKTYDITNTICSCIRNAAPGMVSIVLSRLCGAKAMEAIEEAATQRRQTHPEFRRIIWWWGVINKDEFTIESLKRIRPYDFQS